MRTYQHKQIEVLEQLIIEVSLIEPLSKIIQRLRNNDFRDCDVKWLDKKLKDFTELAFKTLYIEVVLPDDIDGKILNDFTLQQYIDRFSVLLRYFKSI